jgi:hypothetical protein
MLKVIKWLFVLVVTILLLSAACSEPSRIISCEKALEGLAGVFLVRMVLAFSKLRRMKAGYGRIRRLAMFLVPRSMCRPRGRVAVRPRPRRRHPRRG